jgi:tripartite-type tricarboxylate transporter receptor subunit TctC
MMRQAYPICRRSLLLAAVSTACALPAFSQSAKALRLVVPFPPGGGVDATARLLAERLPAGLSGRSVVVENRPGAGGNIAAMAVAQSALDSDTLLITSNNHTINLSLYAKPGYALEDFSPIAQFGVSGFALVAHPSTNFKTLGDLLAAAKAKPDAISFGTGGNGHPAHLAIELLKSRAKVSMQHIPYKGSGPLTADLIGGQLPVGLVSVLAAQSFVASGQLVPLAVTSKQRWPGMPNVPTVEESGFPGYDYSAWIGVLGRSGTSPTNLALLERQILAIGSTEDARSSMYKQGMLLSPKGSADFKESIARDAAVNRDLIRNIGLKLD